MGGDGTVHMVVTPAVEQGAVRLDAEVGDIEADGSLGNCCAPGRSAPPCAKRSAMRF